MTEPSERKSWAPCVCGCAPEDHQAVVLRPICVEHQGKRVLFEGTLGGCSNCGCDLYGLAVEQEADRA